MKTQKQKQNQKQKQKQTNESKKQNTGKITRKNKKQSTEKFQGRWKLYKKTLEYMLQRIKYYEGEMLKYLRHLVNPARYENSKDRDVLALNPAVFTIFNNIPIKLHPLPKELYYDYIAYVSFIDPGFFKLNQQNSQQQPVIKYRSVLTYMKWNETILIQDPAPYNANKMQLGINMMYLGQMINKLLNTNHVLVGYTDKSEKVIIKSRDEFGAIQGKLVWVGILRPIKPGDIAAVFQQETLPDKTRLYSYNDKILKRSDLEFKQDYIPKWYSIKSNEYLKDPYGKLYKPGDIKIEYIAELKTRMDFLNLNKCIFLRDAPVDIRVLLTGFDSSTARSKDLANNIYNGDLNYIAGSNNAHGIFNKNRGKRLLAEIFYKSASIFSTEFYYFDWLLVNGFDRLINSYGYYGGLDKFYDYEIGFMKPEDYVEVIQRNEITIS